MHKFLQGKKTVTLRCFLKSSVSMKEKHEWTNGCIVRFQEKLWVLCSFRAGSRMFSRRFLEFAGWGAPWAVQITNGAVPIIAFRWSITFTWSDTPTFRSYTNHEACILVTLWHINKKNTKQNMQSTHIGCVIVKCARNEDQKCANRERVKKFTLSRVVNACTRRYQSLSRRIGSIAKTVRLARISYCQGFRSARISSVWFVIRRLKLVLSRQYFLRIVYLRCSTTFALKPVCRSILIRRWEAKLPSMPNCPTSLAKIFNQENLSPIPVHYPTNHLTWSLVILVLAARRSNGEWQATHHLSSLFFAATRPDPVLQLSSLLNNWNNRSADPLIWLSGSNQLQFPFPLKIAYRGGARQRPPTG